MSNSTQRGHALVTGGAGFIGTNLVERLLAENHRVVVLDNLSRAGVERNARWLASLAPDRVEIVRDDCRNAPLVARLVRSATQVFHFAAQVAVTTSLVDPMADFEVNLRGTLTVLEALRQLERPPPLIFTSTNKVYGSLGDLALRRLETRYEPVDAELAREGVSERQMLDFHSPYGCSKGGADQYVLDYARSFGLPAVVFRMSCIYGPHQCGNEDQGWVAHFLLRAREGLPISIFGDGLQVRDLLFVDDLVDALLRARDNARQLAGAAFNIGGGPGNAASLLEVLARIGSLLGRAPEVRFGPARCGDQLYYVSNVGKFAAATGWAPKTSVADGVARLNAWFSRDMPRERPAPELVDSRLVASAEGR